MATVGDTIGKAIADVVITFSDITVAAAEYGREWAKTAGHVEGGRCLVVPMGHLAVEGKSYADSALVDFRYGLRFQLVDRDGPEETVAGVMSELRKKFNPEALTLQNAVAALSALTQPLRATIVARVEELDEPERGPARTASGITLDVSIVAQTWVTV